MALGFYNSDEINDIKNKLSFLESKLNSINTDFVKISEDKSDEIIRIHDKSKLESQKISDLLNIIDSSYKNINTQLEVLNNSIQKSVESENKSSLLINECERKINEINAIRESFSNYEINVKNILNEANSYLDSSSKLPETLAKVTLESEEIEKTLKQSKQALQNIVSNKKEIDDLFASINGHDIPIENSENEFQHIDGLKDKLEKSYNSTESKIKSLEETIESEVHSIKNEYQELLFTAKNQYLSLNNDLNSLLPGALAKGLSDAFETKRASEQENLNKLEKYFLYGIGGLIATALIPIAVDFYLLIHEKKDLLDVIKETPNILLATLPIYLPLLWFSHSTSKKYNLSKRLIEEYTHKSVLGKTFSGLSNQIETLPNQNNIKEELRVKLLFNILQVSAENPGKLITDYNKSDHPVFDVIQKSSQLSDSLENLSKIPGFSLISKKISEITEKKLDEVTSKVENGIGVNDILEEGKK